MATQSHDLPPWVREPQLSQAGSSQFSQRKARPSLSTSQRHGTQAAERELLDRAQALSSEIGRSDFLSSLSKWTRYADRKVSDGLVALATLDGLTPAPAPGQALDDARTRIEEGVAAAACSKSTFVAASQLLEAGRWQGHEVDIVLDVDEARCRLINCVGQ